MATGSLTVVKNTELSTSHLLRSLQNAPFCPISASSSNFNPQNTQGMPGVKIFAFSRSKSGIFDLNLTKIEHFSKVSLSYPAGLSMPIFSIIAEKLFKSTLFLSFVWEHTTYQPAFFDFS